MRLLDQFICLIRDDDAQDLIEYALLASFISLAVMAAVLAFGASVGDLTNGVMGRAWTTISGAGS